MDHFKMSTSRDFRIQGDVLKEALAAQEISSDSVSDSEVSLIVLGHCVIINLHDKITLN